MPDFAKAWARFMDNVVLPTPPFWLEIAMLITRGMRVVAGG